VPQGHVRISLLQEIATLLGLLSIPQSLSFCISLPEFLMLIIEQASNSILIMQSPLKRQIY